MPLFQAPQFLAPDFESIQPRARRADEPPRSQEQRGSREPSPEDRHSGRGQTARRPARADAAADDPVDKTPPRKGTAEPAKAESAEAAAGKTQPAKAAVQKARPAAAAAEEAQPGKSAAEQATAEAEQVTAKKAKAAGSTSEAAAPEEEPAKRAPAKKAAKKATTATKAPSTRAATKKAASAGSAAPAKKAAAGKKAAEKVVLEVGEDQQPAAKAAKATKTTRASKASKASKAAKATPAAEETRAAATGTEPATPAEPATTATPAQPAEPATTAGPAQPAEPAKVAEPAATAQPAEASRGPDQPDGFWPRIWARPEYAPELLALAAVAHLGPQARRWATEIRDTYPDASPDGLARLAVRHFTRLSAAAWMAGIAAGRSGAAIELGGVAWAEARLVLHLA
ncbi:MAG: hypothetical protein IRY92_04800, partial [Dactylosporangium sp.]|nr:hypothetical protein [Dactylosporangium sp.]